MRFLPTSTVSELGSNRRQESSVDIRTAQFASIVQQERSARCKVEREMETAGGNSLEPRLCRLASLELRRL